MTINKPLLSIIIVNYNTKYDTYNCVHSILESSVNFDYEIILVDNNSSDGSVEYIEQRFNEIEFIKLSKNTGFSYANNRGFEQSKGNYVLFLNSDTLFRKETLSKIESILISEEHFVIAPKLLNKDLSIQKSLFNFPKYSKTFIRISGLYDLFFPLLSGCKNYAPVNTIHYDYASFAAIIFQRHVFEKVGRLDENILFYHEDCDIGFSLRNTSINTMFCDSIEIIHLGGNSTSKFSKFAFENDILSLQYVFGKNYGQFSGKTIRIVLKVAILFRIFFVWTGVINGIRGFKIYLDSRVSEPFLKSPQVTFLYSILKKL